jgi:hypothetical protein
MINFPKRLFLSLVLLAAAAGCSTTNETPEALAQAEIITLQTTPSLEHWLTDVADCANDIPEFAIVTEIRPMENLDLAGADLTLRLGDRQENDPFVYLMGIEQTIILAGREVPIDSLSLESLQRIFAGEITHWNQATEVIEAGLEINQPIQTLSYPSGHELRLLFQSAYLDDQTIGGQPLIFSTEAALESLLEANSYALAYTLESLAHDGMKKLAVADFTAEQAQHKVLALTPEEPSGKLQQLLLCLQN